MEDKERKELENRARKEAEAMELRLLQGTQENALNAVRTIVNYTKS